MHRAIVFLKFLTTPMLIKPHLVSLFTNLVIVFILGCVSKESLGDDTLSRESRLENNISIRTLAVIKGKCKRYVVGKRRYSCSEIVYMDFPNRRIAFNIPNETGSIMLSGQNDSRLDSTSYKLLIDRIRYSDGNIGTKYDASGYCEVLSSKDQVYIYEIKCRATNGVEKLSIEFVGDGSPVQIMDQ